MAKELGIPATTAREYVGRFKEYFPTKKVAGKRWAVYLDTSQDTLKDIVDGYKNGMSSDEIREELQVKYPINIDADNEKLQRGKSDNNAITTTASSLDIVTQLQVQQFQWLQKQSELMERQTELLERMVKMTEDLQVKTASRRPTSPKKKKSPSKRNTEPRKQPQKRQQTKKTKKKGLFGIFGG